MKNFILICICALLVCVFVMPASAAQSTTATLSASPNPVHPGDTFTLTVSVAEVNECTSAGFMFSFDKAVFEYVSGTKGASLDAFGSAGVSTAAGNIAGFAMNGTAKVQGELFQITLKVKEGVAFGTYTFGGTLSMNATDGVVTCTTQSLQLAVVCNHNYGGWVSDGEHTHTHTCTICYGVETVEHTWNDGEVTTAASCSAEGVRTHACTGCGATKTSPVEKIPHKYSNSCDTSCNVCGGERKITHKYSDKWTTDENAHWHKCSVCGSKKDEEAHKPGPEPTEQTSQNCTVCGYIIKEALGHTHDYQLEWTNDSTGHWHACTGCQNQNEFTEHQFENTCDKDCNTCGYERETEHIYYENYLSSEDGHWHECRVCGYQLEMEHHTPNESGMCTGCGYKTVAEDHAHGFEGPWDWDASGHWQTCECGENRPAEPHSWDDGEITKKPTDTADGARTYKCTVCGAQKTELIPMGTVITDSFPWVVLLIVGGVLILGVVVYIVIGVASSKKKAGRFSGEASDEELETVEE